MTQVTTAIFCKTFRSRYVTKLKTLLSLLTFFVICKSSEVYSADVFHTVFKADPMSTKEGRRYRYAVLEKGGSWNGVKILTEFLGRRPCDDSFNGELGLE